MKVKECMCENVCCVKPETTVKEVAKLMCTKCIGSVPICDSDDCICGIITDRDIILKTLACDKDPNCTKVEEIMSKNVCTCKENDDISVVETKMAENQIRRIPVCNEENNIIGILTLKDLTENQEKIGCKEIGQTLKEICEK